MEEERTNLVPRLQQDAYLPRFAAAQPGPPHLLEPANLTRINGAFETTYNHSPAVANRYDTYGVQSLSTTSFPGSYPPASFHFSGFPYSVDTHGIFNEHSNNDFAPFNESHNLAQGLPAAGIPNRYLPDSFDYPDTLRFDTNASLSAQPHVFYTGPLGLTTPIYAQSGYGGVSAALQYYSDPSSHPFATDAAFNSTDTFATASNPFTNGHVLANNPMHMPVSKDPIGTLDIGLMNEGPILLPPNIYNTGQASANYPFPMHSYPIVPMELGPMTDGPIALSPNNYTTSQVSANNPLPMPTSNSALIPVDIGPPISQRTLCTKCSQTFKRQSDLERHAKKHQSGPKDFKCPIGGCDYASYRKDKLVEHMRRRHPAGGSRVN